MTTSAPVLIVNGDLALRQLLELVLVTEGYAVAVAADGGQALRYALQVTPRLIVLDDDLPDLSGSEVVRALRGLGRMMPILMLSVGDDATRAAMAGGASALLVKPFDLDCLLATVASLCGPPMDGAAITVVPASSAAAG